jgi:crotonobetainyl-CoA:carnitine CoA-transferase CaiB-like acyl-CoA transferase
VDEIATTQWAKEREAVVDVSDRGDGVIRVPNSPWHFSESDTSVQGVTKYRGEDNEFVCREILGMSTEAITDLERDGVLVSRVPKS